MMLKIKEILTACNNLSKMLNVASKLYENKKGHKT